MRRGCGLGLFNLEKREQELIAVFDSLKGGYREDGAGLFSEGCHKGTRSNMHKLLRGQF